MSNKGIHVVTHGNQWAVRREGQAKPISNHRTQTAAAAAGTRVARAGKAELMIHRPNGQIREKNSFGNDPYPPKG
jgi:hypothetical protein